MPTIEELRPPKGLVTASVTDAARALGYALRKDGFQRYVMLSKYGLRGEGVINAEKNREFFTDLLNLLMQEGNTFLWKLPRTPLISMWQLEILDSASSPEEAQESNVPAALLELSEASTHVLRSVLHPGTTLLHLLLAARGPAREESSDEPVALDSLDMVRLVLEMATYRNWPVYAETTSPRTRDNCCLGLGFKLLRTVQLGVDRVDGDGIEHEGGCGVTIYIVLWLPPGYENVERSSKL